MSDEPQSGSEPGSSGGGVFGNLPDSRPGTRSPRRDSGRAAKGGSGDAPRKPAASKRRTTPAPAPERPAPTEPRPAAERPEQTPAPEAEPPKEGGGLEDIAWAGVAAAAEAATIGVRLASRAIEALRGNTEKTERE